MNRCSPWVRQQTQLPTIERASFFGIQTKRLPKRKAEDDPSSPKAQLPPTKQRTLEDVMLKKSSLSKAEYSKFEKNLAMHYYLTDADFQKVEEPHLLSALQILDPCIRLPSKKRLEGTLLKHTYQKFLKQSSTWLANRLVCLAADGWSNSRPLPALNYTALSGETGLFLEAVADSGRGGPQQLADNAIRVIEGLQLKEASVSGMVTDNTPANREMWGLLNRKFPSMFFYGCIVHGLHLLEMDLFSDSKQRFTNPLVSADAGAKVVNGDIEIPIDQALEWPFEAEMKFIDECKDLVSFFNQNQYEGIQLSFDNRVRCSGKYPKQSASVINMCKGILNNEENLRSVICGSQFPSASSAVEQEICDGIKKFILDNTFSRTLRKVIDVLQPIDDLIGKYQDASVPMSEVYEDLAFCLPQKYKDLEVQGKISSLELEHIILNILNGRNILCNDVHNIAHCFDPALIREDLNHFGDAVVQSRREDIIFCWTPNGPTDDLFLKDSLKKEYLGFRRMLIRQKHEGTQYFQRLSKRIITPLVFWQDQKLKFPRLSRLAIRVFSLSPSSVEHHKNLSTGSIPLKIRNDLGAEKMQMLTFIRNNYGILYPNRESRYIDGDDESFGPDLGIHEIDDGGDEVDETVYLSMEK